MCLGKQGSFHISASLIKKQQRKVSFAGDLMIYLLFKENSQSIYILSDTHDTHLVFHHHEEEENVKMQNTFLRMAIKYSPAMYHWNTGFMS